jgi:uncharacterized protein (DUF433 family)
MPKPRSTVRSFGRHIVADPKICHGELTFRGTRVFVADVLSQVADGMDWDEIRREWRGSISRAAIAEAVELARRALISSNRPPRRRSAA